MKNGVAQEGLLKWRKKTGFHKKKKRNDQTFLNAHSALSKILTSLKLMAKFPLNSTGSQFLRGPF